MQLRTFPALPIALLLASAGLLADGAPSPKDARSALRTPSDLAADLILGEPDIVQPVFLNFDERGRLWVVEYAQYPHPAGLRIVSRDRFWRNVYDKIPPPPPRHIPGADRVSIHEDADGDGSFESKKVFLEGLNMVTSVTVGRGGVWVLNPPYLLFYPDADRDDRPDRDPVVHLKGFWLEDSHSIANSLRWGPDGWLYGAQGSTVSADIVVVAPGAPKAEPIHTVGQLIWRYHPEEHRFEIWAEGGGNAFGCEIDSKGRIFSGHNGGDTRGFHYPQHGYLRKGFNKHGPLSNPYAFGYFPHMPHNRVSRFTHTFEIYEGAGLPEKYRGKIFGADPMNRNVPISEITPDGATFRTQDIGHALSTSDPWFRPVDIKSGPDGALYVADWCDQQVNHYRNHEGKIDKTNGRIFRVRAASGYEPAGRFDLAERSTTELIEMLSHPNRWHRQTARRLIGDRRDQGEIESLRRRIRETEKAVALEYLWALNLSGGFDEEYALSIVDHADPHVRTWVVRLLGDRREISTSAGQALARRAAAESNVEVRSQLASTAKRLPAGQALPIVEGLLGHDVDVNDRYMPLLVWWAIESKCENDGDRVLELFKKSATWSRQQTKTHIASRLVRRFAASGRSADLERCAELLELAPSDDAAKPLLRGFEEAFEGRALGALPKSLVDALARRGGGSLALRVRQGSEEAVEEAIGAILDPKKPTKERIRLIDTFGQVAVQKSVPSLQRALREAQKREVRQALLAALARYDDAEIGETVIGVFEKLSREERAAAEGLLASRVPWSAQLLDAVESKKLDRLKLSLEGVRRLLLHKDEKLTERVEELFGDVKRATSAKLEARMKEIRAIVTTKTGDPYAGQKLFRESCVSCHYLFNEGGKVGPDLTAYQRQDLDAMLLGIVHPSAEVREGFESYSVVTKDARVLVGVLVERDAASVKIRSAEGQDTTIARSEILEIQVRPESLMPESLLDDWEEKKLRDLFAYLKSTQPLAN